MKLKNSVFVAVFLTVIVFAYSQSKFQTRVEIVNVDMVVTTKSGEVVSEGLTEDDFEVYENGVKQGITNFSPIEGPLTTVLLIDYSRPAIRLSNYSPEEILYGPLEFVRGIREDDWVAIVMYDKRVYVSKEDENNKSFSNFTQNKQDLEEVLNTIYRNPAVWEESCLVDAVKSVLDLITENKEDLTNKVSVVVFSTGLDTFSQNLYEPVLKQAQNSGVVIYTVGIGQHLRAVYDSYIETLDRMELTMSDNRLRFFAELTGGKMFLPKFATELPAIFEEVSTRLRNQYSLGYISSNTSRDGKFRKIEIKVTKTVPDKNGKPQKLNVSHRKGYFAPKD